MSTSGNIVDLSASAAARIAVLIETKGNPKLKFRVAVNGGGCSGFQYDFNLVEDQKSDDIVVKRDGVTMLIDGLSAMYVAGSELDFVEELAGSMFVMKNPNATASCGCGSSFAV